MTLKTMIFKHHKKNGLIKKIGTAEFTEALRVYQRALWKDYTDNKLYVIFNHEAYEFKPWTAQPKDEDLIIGRIINNK